MTHYEIPRTETARMGWTREDVVDLNLCEQKRLDLRPGVLYRFTVDPKCPQCQRLKYLMAEPTPDLTHRPGRAI